MGRRIQLGALPPLPPEEEAGYQKGLATEDIFFEAAGRINRGHQKPLYLTWIDRASPEEDARGIDATAQTDTEKLYIQIKSSPRGAAIFLEKLSWGIYPQGPFLLITIEEGADIDDVVDGILRGLDELYRMVSQ